MFQLIVAVIAIALVIALTLAAIWLGGDVYEDSSARADYARNVNSASQIEGALQLYYAENSKEAYGEDQELLDNLVDWGYLKNVPDGDWTVNSDTLYKPIEIQTVRQCSVMNEAAGYDVAEASTYDGCPPCNGEVGSQQLADAVTFKNWPGCQFID